MRVSGEAARTASILAAVNLGIAVHSHALWMAQTLGRPPAPPCRAACSQAAVLPERYVLGIRGEGNKGVPRRGVSDMVVFNLKQPFPH